MAPAPPGAPTTRHPLNQVKRTAGKGSCLSSAAMRFSSVQASPRIAMRLHPIAPIVLALADTSAGEGRQSSTGQKAAKFTVNGWRNATSKL